MSSIASNHRITDKDALSVHWDGRTATVLIHRADGRDDNPGLFPRLSDALYFAASAYDSVGCDVFLEPSILVEVLGAEQADPESQLDTVYAGYVGGLLWSEACRGTAPAGVCSHNGRGEDCDVSLRSLGYAEEHLSPQARQKIRADVLAFLRGNWIAYLAWVLGEDADGEDFGYNLVINRNGHGAGFWDRGRGDLGNLLSRAAATLGETYASADSGKRRIVHVD